eukprot:TRINITY_DN63911_c0_g1_i1.p1 TRINITY_DN63911_c0_g1~~TRINITY_DN63911_c0_g1_i1.p1  ORF type:complete len:386 (+),score=58.72 TRINITY_DN63911_c0_g1_i1:77-1234(+)
MILLALPLFVASLASGAPSYEIESAASSEISAFDDASLLNIRAQSSRMDVSKPGDHSTLMPLASTGEEHSFRFRRAVWDWERPFENDFASISAGTEETSRDSSQCEVFPTKRLVVMLTLDASYIESGVFQNWLSSAMPFLDGDKQLVISVADTDTLRLLEHMPHKLPDDVVFLDRYGTLRRRSQSNETTAALGQESKRDHLQHAFGTSEFFELMQRRPEAIYSLLVRGCHVLHVDVDTVWIKDVFADIDAAVSHDLLLVVDNCDTTEKVTLCGCFMHFRPWPGMDSFFVGWSNATKHSHGNEQRGLNKFLWQDYESSKTVNFAILPSEHYPSGCKFGSMEDLRRALVSKAPLEQARVVHANWVHGTEEKIHFLTALGLWNTSEAA